MSLKIVNNGTDPDDSNFVVDVCNKFLLENVALVKVEMATKTLTRFNSNVKIWSGLKGRAKKTSHINF